MFLAELHKGHIGLATVKKRVGVGLKKNCVGVVGGFPPISGTLDPDIISLFP